MAEWLCSGLQSRGRRFDSDSSLHVSRHCRIAWQTLSQRPGGGIGRRKGLKIPRDLISCRFESGPGHHFLFSTSRISLRFIQATPIWFFCVFVARMEYVVRNPGKGNDYG